MFPEKFRVFSEYLEYPDATPLEKTGKEIPVSNISETISIENYFMFDIPLVCEQCLGMSLDPFQAILK